MLHFLRNDEVYPYFWQRRVQDEAPAPFTFLDLNALKASWLASKQGSDQKLEAQLYGSKEKPHYSGWTMKRLETTLAQSGYEPPKQLWATENLISVVAKPGRWGFSERRGAASWRRGQRIWSWRKGLRSKAGELRSRFEALRHPTNLSGDDLWLNLGAGAENYPAYIKVDIAGAQDVYDNIVALSKIADASVAKIYCNHVLEHIPVELLPVMLNRWREVLKPGGVVTARMPDAKQALLSLNEKWVETNEQELARLDLPNFLERESSREGVLDDDSCIQSIYGWSNSTPHSWDEPNQHKSLWTPLLARERFEAAGFKVEVAENLGTLNTVIVARK